MAASPACAKFGGSGRSGCRDAGRISPIRRRRSRWRSHRNNRKMIGMSSTDWLTLVLIGITGWYAWITRRILKANEAMVAAVQAQQHAAMRPYVQCNLRQNPRPNLIYLEVENVGKITATDLRLSLNRTSINLAATKTICGSSASTPSAIRPSCWANTCAPSIPASRLAHGPEKHGADGLQLQGLLPPRAQRQFLHHGPHGHQLCDRSAGTHAPGLEAPDDGDECGTSRP